jgi:hypothetical protein
MAASLRILMKYALLLLALGCSGQNYPTGYLDYDGVWCKVDQVTGKPIDCSPVTGTRCNAPSTAQMFPEPPGPDGGVVTETCICVVVADAGFWECR